MYGLFVAVIAHLFTPFLLAPAIAAVSLMMFAMDPRARWLPLTAGYIAVVLVPWLFELAGVLTDTTTSVAGNLVLRSEAVAIVMPQAELALALFAVTLIAIAGYMAARLAQTHRRAVRALELQAWHQRQLVSRPHARAGKPFGTYAYARPNALGWPRCMRYIGSSRWQHLAVAICVARHVSLQ